MSGATGAGNHMWNLVRMDGCNYLVDVTNCDTGTVGASDIQAESLFMRCFAAGSVSTQYTVTCGDHEVTYTYSDNTRSVFSSGELTLFSVRPKDDVYTLTPEPTTAFSTIVYPSNIEDQAPSYSWKYRKYSGANGGTWGRVDYPGRQGAARRPAQLRLRKLHV